jgi:hypothetical protein
MSVVFQRHKRSISHRSIDGAREPPSVGHSNVKSGGLDFEKVKRARQIQGC